ncbi:MFS family permease [Allocatelliglobosispora scoriae]|uniref:MFS family permease n=1 Tax=Allocatelliglobosispora scoriae TaxID=643052 RepID=A0A841BV95_9ACTN|nr:hypothetical protein [Allocatelliglobosispora scoriae]MBB5873017.1 MFS family permease [Allocatelliglobosispora scoriae]
MAVGLTSSEQAARPSTRAVAAADLITLAACLALVGAAAVVGVLLNRAGHPVYTMSPPIYAAWMPHADTGSVFAVAIAVLVIGVGPALARRMGWVALLGAAYLGALAWTMALAMIDGWKVGFADRLTTDSEYLHDVPRITDAGAMLRGFTDHILDFQPDSWGTHVSGHPPGITLLFVGLDRIGLGGGAWAAIVCVLVGAVAAVGVPLTVRLLDGEERARAVVPFTVLFPGAIWVGASADGLFMGVAVVGLTLLAAAATRPGRGGPVLGVAAGLVLGATLFLSYGLVLIAFPALAMVLLTRRWTLIGWALGGAAVVVAGFALAGFWWLDGYHLVVERYYQGVANERSYAYWVWANLACLVLAAGPAVIVAVRRALLPAMAWVHDHIPGWVHDRAPRRDHDRVPGRGHDRVPGQGHDRRNSSRVGPMAVWVLPVAGLVAIMAADLSGMSKAEVERIWLPFTIWLLPAVALLPSRSHRWWLTVQAVTALSVNHLLYTIW